MRLGVIAAAGKGSRFNPHLPKQLARIGNTTLLELAFNKLSEVCDVVCVVTSVDILNHANWPVLPKAVIRIQESLKGMGDAIFSARDLILESELLVTLWADQVGISKKTLEDAIKIAESQNTKCVVIPNVVVENPYVEFVWRGSNLLRILETREGEVTNSAGLADVGTFIFSKSADLPIYWDKYLKTAKLGKKTGEVNFLPFLPWLSSEGVNLIRSDATLSDRAAINTLSDLNDYLERNRN